MPLLPYTPELAAALAKAQAANVESDETRRWRKGDLSWKLLPHQRTSYGAFYAWNERRQTPEYAQHVERVGAQFDDVFVDYSARRVGKTSEKILILAEAAIRRPNSVLTYFTALHVDIGGVIMPLARELVMGQDCPTECRPVFRAKNAIHGMGLAFPNGSYLKLVGVDKNPDGLRGRFSDGIVGTETSFVKSNALDGQGLDYIVKSVLLPQLQRRPWAFLVLETSAPKDPEHPMLTIFKPDAEARGACIERTLDDNTSLSEAEYNKTIRQAGGRGDINCEREYFNIVERDPSQSSGLIPW